MIPRLILRLLRLFAIGTLHATAVQTLAAAAYTDGWCRDHQVARQLKSAGNDGRNRQHIHRAIMDLVRAAGLLSGMSKPYIVSAPGPKGTTNDITMYLPHETITNAIFGQLGGLDAFCLTPAQLANAIGLGLLLRQWGRHPDVELDPNPDNVPILGLHCDCVVYTTGLRAGESRSVIVSSLNVVSGQSKAICGERHLLFVLGKGRLCDCGCGGFHTISVLAWSLGCLKDGVAPSCRHDGAAWTAADFHHRFPAGAPLPRAALLQIRGDWEWLQQCFRFRSAASEQFCWMCNASKSGHLRYTRFALDAPRSSPCNTVDTCLIH